MFLTSAAVTCLLFIDFCALVFACGCRPLWAGAAEACNIHHDLGKHCPWCSYGYAGYALAFVPVVAAQAAVSFAARPRSALLKLACAVVTFPAVGGVVAALFGLLTGYWK